MHSDTAKPADFEEMDEQLITAVRRGDDVASAPLYPYLRPSIEGGLRRVFKRPSTDFEDLVQLTFERVVRTILSGGFHGRCKLSTWAHAIAVRVAIDATRRHAVETHYFARSHRDSSQPALASTLAERQLEARSNLKLVGEVLSRMSPTHARATYLRHALEYPMDDVARRLGLSPTATASQLRRARLELTRRFKLRTAESRGLEAREPQRP